MDMDENLAVEIALKLFALKMKAIKQTERKIEAHITSRMKTVSPSLSAAQALDDLRMAVESGDYEATP